MSANSQTVVVFSDTTSALTSSRRISFLSAAYVASLSISVFSRSKSAATNSVKSSAAPFSNSTSCSFAIARASATAAACRSFKLSPSPHSTTSVFSASSFPNFMRWSSPVASATNTVNGAGSSKYASSCATASSRFFSPNFSIASASSRNTICSRASIGSVCACSSAVCVSPRFAEYRDTAHARAASGTNFSINCARQASRKYGSSPSNKIAGMAFPFSSRAIPRSPSVILRHCRHQPRCKVLRQAIQRRVLLLEKALHIRRDLILIAKHEIVRVIEDFPRLALFERDLALHGHHHRRGPRGPSVKQQRHDL